MKAKKILAIALTFVMAMGMSVTAFAAEGSETKEGVPGSKSIEVTGKYGDVKPDTRFSVDIEWGAMQFTYKTGGTAEWDPTTHTYKVTQGSDSWENVGNVVTVTNHSNTDLDVAFAFNKSDRASEYGNYTGNLAVNGDTHLAAAVEGSELSSAAKATATLTFEGTLKADQTDFATLGEITVSLSKE